MRVRVRVRVRVRANPNPNPNPHPTPNPNQVGGYLSDIVESTLADLENAGCVEVGSEHDLDAVAPTTLGRVSSYYYLKYTSVALFHAELHDVDECCRRSTVRRRGPEV